MDKSYFRITYEVFSSNTVEDQPVLSDLMAPADNLCGNLYNNAQFYAGGRQVSQIVNGLPQASALKARLLSSSASLESVGASAFLHEGEFAKRQQMVCSDAQKSSLSDDYTLLPLTTVAADQRSATVAIDVAGIVTGVGTEFTSFVEGDTLVVDDQRFQIVDITSVTSMTVSPVPTLAITAVSDAYVVKQTPKASAGANKRFCMWKPPLGIFDLDTPLPAGDYRIALNPSQDYKSAGIETLLGDQTNPAPVSFYNLKITDVRFYLATVKQSVPQSLTSTIFECEVQSKPASTASSTLNFTIPSSTRAITVWVQSDDNGKNTLIPPSKFVCFPNGDNIHPERGIESLQLTYSNMTKPSVRWASAYDKTTGVNQLQQRYRDTYDHAGMLNNSGGIERFEEYIERGPIYHFSWNRSSEDRSTELQISTTFQNALGPGVSLYICSWYSRALAIDSVAGQIRDVETRTV
jgi:hypothetical protein